MKENDNIYYHRIHYALGKNNTIPKLNSSCAQYKFQIFCASYLENLLKNHCSTCSSDEQLSNVIRIIKDISIEHKLYMAHITRCYYQSKVIADIDKLLQAECAAS